MRSHIWKYKTTKNLILINILVLPKPNFSSENLIECLKYITEVQKGSLDKCGSEPTNKYFSIQQGMLSIIFSQAL